jgi:hypothetical protein
MSIIGKGLHWFVVIGFGLDVFTRFCKASSHDIATPDRFRHDFGPCGPRPTGGFRIAIS